VKPKTSFISVLDQFCGAGGSSLGATAAGAEVVVALNHWELAIRTHNSNFPDAYHECTDISACDPRRFPATDVMTTSPECTNHSLAKGKKRKNQGQLSLWGENKIDPAEERSRATMWDVPRFAEFHQQNIIVVENVVDARNWVPFEAWLKAMHLLGYKHEIVYYNSMFAHPTPQSRDRMYVVFWRKGNKKPNLKFTPPAFCQRCEKNVNSVQSFKPGKTWGRYGKRNQYVYTCPTCGREVQPYYFCAANAIDWSIQGERIGDRKKPLKARTMERIQYGLKKYGRQLMMVQVDFSHSDSPRTRPATDPMATQTGRQVSAMLMPFVMPNQGDKYISRDVLGPLHTQVASVQPSLIMPFMVSPNNRTLRAVSVDDVFPTQTGSLRNCVVVPQAFMFSYYGERPATQPLDDAMITMTTMGNHALVSGAPFLMSYYTREDASSDLNEALPTVTAEPRHSLVMPAPYLVSYYSQGDASSPVDGPLPTVTTRDRHGLVMPFVSSFYGNAQASGIDDALPTMMSQDKHALVQPEPELNIEDCYFRMLQPHEIGRAMAFPDSYIVLGNNREKVKQYGNAVTPPVLQMIIERCIETLQ
jgi:DNA (cytosine-5)-methyltransferase 1